VKRRPAGAVPRLDGRAARQQQRSRLNVALAGGCVQRDLAVLSRVVDCGAGVEQQRNDGGAAAAAGRGVERALADLDVALRGGRAARQKLGAQREIARLGSRRELPGHGRLERASLLGALGRRGGRSNLRRGGAGRCNGRSDRRCRRS